MNSNIPPGSDTPDAPWNRPDVVINADELMRALDSGVQFDGSSLEIYADGLLEEIADRIRDRIVNGSHKPFDLDAAIKEVANKVEKDAIEWLGENQ